MKFALVFSSVLALAWSHSHHIPFPGSLSTLVPVPRHISWTDVAEVPVNVAHDFIRTFGFVKPSDDEIRDYANTIGFADKDVTSALRALYTDPAMVLLQDDNDKVVAYYADTGIHFMNAYPETRATFNSLLDASNAAALVYKPERFLYPTERKYVASRFFSPANFRLRDIGYDYPDHVHVVDAPVVLRKFAFPTHYAKSRSPYTLFDIEKIPYAYKSPVYFRLSETTSPVWYKAIDSDVYPINAGRITYPAVKSAHVIPSDVITPYARYGFNKIVTDIDASSPIVKSLSYLPEAEWPDKEYVRKVPIYPDTWENFHINPINERRLVETSSSPYVYRSGVPLVASKTLPLVRSSFVTIPTVDDVITKSYPTIDTTAYYDAKTTPYVIRPEYLKTAAVPTLTAAEPKVASSTIGIPNFPVFRTSFF